MALAGKSVWLLAERAVEAVGGQGTAIWSRPPEVRRAIAELGGVFPATHLVLDLEAVRAASGPEPTWTALLARSGGWTEVLAELAPAIASALRPPTAFGFALPDPRRVAADLGDASERGVLKAGLRVASFLQGLRSAGVAVVAVLLDGEAGPEVVRALTPVLRNAGLYGWRRGVTRAAIAAPLLPESDVRLVSAAALAELEPAWARGEEVGGALEGAFRAERLGGRAPAVFLLWGAAPSGVDAAGVVAAGRALRQWFG